MATEQQQTDGTSSTRKLGGEITKIGNLTREPELRFGQSGKAYARFGIAVDSPKTPGDWGGEKTTTFYDVTTFDSLAHNTAETLHKGMRVIVVGRPEIRDYTDAEGNARQQKQIAARSCGVDLLWATAEVKKNPKRSGGEARTVDSSDEEIPF